MKMAKYAKENEKEDFCIFTATNKLIHLHLQLSQFKTSNSKIK
jgi:hypothetical protein